MAPALPGSTRKRASRPRPMQLPESVMTRRDKPFETPTAQCSIERSLQVLGERWTFLILRQAFAGTTRFADFQASLGAAADVLSRRLTTLVCAGILEKSPYRSPGDRARADYHLTDTGRSLAVVLGALQQWGDEHLPLPAGPAYGRRDRRTGEPLSVAFVNPAGAVVAIEDATIVAPTSHIDQPITDETKVP